MDFADIVTIEKGGVEVYDENRHQPYPKVGEKLNKKAKITLFQIEKLDGMEMLDFIQALEDAATG